MRTDAFAEWACPFCDSVAAHAPKQVCAARAPRKPIEAVISKPAAPRCKNSIALKVLDATFAHALATVQNTATTSFASKGYGYMEATGAARKQRNGGGQSVPDLAKKHIV